MAGRFDPYYEWLGISPNDQPPHHYRLLGIDLFEKTPTVIEHAADQRMAHLRTFQTGRHAAESQKVLNEVAAAKICLLNPAKKAAYDQRLRQQLQPSSQAAENSDSGSQRPKPSLPKPAILIVAGVALVGAAAVLGLALWGGTSGGEPAAGSLAKVDEPPRTVLPPKTEPKPSGPSGAAHQEPSKPAEAPKVIEEVKEEPKEEVKEKAKVEIPTQEEKTPATPKVEKDAAKEAPAERPKPEAETGPAKKIEPPPRDEQKRLITILDEVYKPGDAKDRAAKVALARKLLEDGQKNEANRAEQFVMLRRAGEIAQGAGEAELMLEAVDAMTAAGFNIQPFQVKAWLLKRLVEDGISGGAPQRSAISEACVKFAEQAAAGGAVDEASDVLGAAREALAEPKKHAQQAQRTAKAAAARIRNPADKTAQEKKVTEAEDELEAIEAALGSMAKCAKGLQQARREQEAISAALERLKTQPDDPDTCLMVGRWYCFYKGDWDQGLRLLAKGSDDTLKKLAEEELASRVAGTGHHARMVGVPSAGPGTRSVPTTLAEDKVARGDAWWDLAEKATGKAKSGMRQRAGHWYQEALPDLASGLVKSRVEKRLVQVPEEEMPETHAESGGSRPALAVAPFDAQKAKELQEAWATYLRLPVEMTNAIGMTLVLIPPGEFTMGDDDVVDAKPAHRVKITKAFYLGKYEVTQEQWAAVMGNNPSEFKGPKNPVSNVGWDDCQVFLQRLNQMAAGAQGSQRKRVKGKSGAVRGSCALPTQAQWEYACRAGSAGAFCFGNAVAELDEFAWYDKNSGGKTHPVGEKKAGPWGLYDVYGNVAEWCLDWHDKDYYRVSPGIDPTGPPSGSHRVVRGASWRGPVWLCRSGNRYDCVPGNRADFLGLRVSLVLADK